MSAQVPEVAAVDVLDVEALFAMVGRREALGVVARAPAGADHAAWARKHALDIDEQGNLPASATARLGAPGVLVFVWVLKEPCAPMAAAALVERIASHIPDALPTWPELGDVVAELRRETFYPRSVWTIRELDGRFPPRARATKQASRPRAPSPTSATATVSKAGGPTVDASRRFTGDRRCPVCDGSERDPRGQGIRCTGFLSGDGRWAHCSREDRAGGLEFVANSQTFAHRLGAKCRCGETHGDTVESSPPAPARRTGMSDLGPIVATYDYTDESGELLFQALRYEPEGQDKRFLQRHRDASHPKAKKDGWVWNLDGVRRVLYRMPKLVDQAHVGERVIVVEGEKDVHTAEQLGFLATCNAMGAGKWRDEYSEPLRGRRVFVIPDNDAPGRMHLQQVLRSCRKAGVEARAIALPGDGWGKDLTDWVTHGGGTRELLEQLLDAAAAAPPSDGGTDGSSGEPEDDDRPIIVIRTDEEEVNDEAIALLGRDPSIYQRGETLARVVTMEADDDSTEPIRRQAGTPRLFTLEQPTLREKLTSVARWRRVEDTKGETSLVPAHPPQWAVKGIAGRGVWKGLRRLEAVVESPALRRDGTILREPGYDRATKLILSPNSPQLAIPESPTIDDAATAALAIIDLLADFPFKTNGHKAAAVAAILTPFARDAFDGPSPLFLFDANTRGSGKSLLADIVGLIATGRGLARMTNTIDDAEANKLITALALEGDRIVLIDNVAGKLGTPSLDAALTGDTWKGRILGLSKVTKELPLRVTWLATGNNVELVGDTARRTLYVRLESPLERPEERTGFRHPNIRKWVLEQRPALVSAALTILRAYCVAGRPSMKLKPWGSFEGWSDLVRCAVVWAGLPDPCGAREELVLMSDVQAEARRDLLVGWEELDPECEGVTVSTMLSRLDERVIPSDPPRLKFERLRNALLDLVPTRQGKPMASREVAWQLRKLRGTVVGGKALDCRVNREGVQRWFVKVVST